MNNFSIQKYCIDNNLLDKSGKIITQNTITNCTWGIAGNQWTIKIYLCTLIHFFEDKCMLDNLDIEIQDNQDGNKEYLIAIKEKDRNYDYAHPNLEWDLILDTIDFLLPSMAGSNISYLAEGVFFDN